MPRGATESMKARSGMQIAERQVEVNGAPAGTTPPLTPLELPQGTHTITVRNADFPPHVVRVAVDPERPVTVKHRFGS